MNNMDRRIIFWNVLLLCGTLSIGAPITSNNSRSELLTAYHYYGTVFLSASVVLFIGLLFGCACCTKRSLRVPKQENGEEELRHSNYSILENRSEFALFPPRSVIPDHNTWPTQDDKVIFEPLPDVLPRRVTQRSSLRSLKPAHFRGFQEKNSFLRDWLDESTENFPRTQLHYLKELGNGWFGRVVEGEAHDIAAKGRKMPVIVKILREEASPSEHLYFLREVNPFRDLSHPNIIRLQGYCLEADPFLLIMEHTKTNLKSFIREHKNDDVWLPDRHVLKMACDIAAGLNYMHEHGFVQMDMAAHNCFVGEDRNIKIGDYGISYETFKDDYYCFGDIAIPVRWYPPEALLCTATTIETKVINQEANIWSFGIVLWELLQFGDLPYKELSDEEVIQGVIVDKNVILAEPTCQFSFAKQLYQLMTLCWKSAEERLSMTEILSFLFDLSGIHNKSFRSTSFEESVHPVEERCNSINVTIDLNPESNGTVVQLPSTDFNSNTADEFSTSSQSIMGGSSGFNPTTYHNCDYFLDMSPENNTEPPRNREDKSFPVALSNLTCKDTSQTSFAEKKYWSNTVKMKVDNFNVNELEPWSEVKHVIHDSAYDIGFPEDRFNYNFDHVKSKQNNQKVTDGNGLNAQFVDMIPKNVAYLEGTNFQDTSNDLNKCPLDSRSNTDNNINCTVKLEDSNSLSSLMNTFKDLKLSSMNTGEWAKTCSDNSDTPNSQEITLISSNRNVNSSNNFHSMDSEVSSESDEQTEGSSFRIADGKKKAEVLEFSSLGCPSCNSELCICIELENSGDNNFGKILSPPCDKSSTRQNTLPFNIIGERYFSDASSDMFHTDFDTRLNANVEDPSGADALNNNNSKISPITHFTSSGVAATSCSKIVNAHEETFSVVPVGVKSLEEEHVYTENLESKCFENSAFSLEPDEEISTLKNSKFSSLDESLGTKKLNDLAVLPSDTAGDECHTFQYFVTQCDMSHSSSDKYVIENMSSGPADSIHSSNKPDCKPHFDCHNKQSKESDLIPSMKPGFYNKYERNSLTIEDLDTGQMKLVPNTGNFDYNMENDEVLKIDTDTNEAILVDASESLIGFVPSRSIEQLQECSSMIMPDESFVDLPSCKHSSSDGKFSSVSSPALSSVTHSEMEDMFVTDDELPENRTESLEDDKLEVLQNRDTLSMDISGTFNTFSEISTTPGECSFDQGLCSISDSPERSPSIVLESSEIMAGDIFGNPIMSEQLRREISFFNKSNCEFSANQLRASVFLCDSAASSPGREVYTPDFESDSDESSSGTSCTSTSGSFECIHNKFSCINNIALEDDYKDEDQTLSKYAEPGTVKIFSKSWDSNATPTRGVLKTPDKKCGQMRKSVSFHEEDPQLVYQYPPPSDSSEEEFLDNDSFSWHVDYTSYADWDLQVAEDDDIPEEIIEIEELSPEMKPISSYRSTPLQGLPKSMMYTLTSFTDADLELQESAPVSLCSDSLGSYEAEEFDIINEEEEFSSDGFGYSKCKVNGLSSSNIIIEEIVSDESEHVNAVKGTVVYSDSDESGEIFHDELASNDTLLAKELVHIVPPNGKLTELSFEQDQLDDHALFKNSKELLLSESNILESENHSKASNTNESVNCFSCLMEDGNDKELMTENFFKSENHNETNVMIETINCFIEEETLIEEDKNEQFISKCNNEERANSFSDLIEEEEENRKEFMSESSVFGSDCKTDIKKNQANCFCENEALIVCEATKSEKGLTCQSENHKNGNVKKEEVNCLNEIEIFTVEAVVTDSNIKSNEDSSSICEIVKNSDFEPRKNCLNSQNDETTCGPEKMTFDDLFDIEIDLGSKLEFCPLDDSMKHESISDNIVIENTPFSPSELLKNDSFDNVISSENAQSTFVDTYERLADSEINAQSGFLDLLMTYPSDVHVNSESFEVGDSVPGDQNGSSLSRLLNYGSDENLVEKSGTLECEDNSRSKGELPCEELEIIDTVLCLDDTGPCSNSPADAPNAAKDNLNTSRQQVPVIIVTDADDDDFTFDEEFDLLTSDTAAGDYDNTFVDGYHTDLK